MDSVPKRLKPLEEPPAIAETPGGGASGDDDDDDKEDRISNMPDEILCHILSKLPTKHAVGTAVLSTKWKHLFSSIPNLDLDIDDSLLLHPHHQDAVAATAGSNPVSHPRNTNFIHFMYNLLTVTLRDVPSIRRFALHCNQDYGNDNIDAWISAVLGLKVSALAMFFHVKNTGVSVHSLFRSETLVSLFWTQHYLVDVPSTVNLPNLKRLYLDSIIFPDYDSFDSILSGCPVLEELCVENCVFEDMICLGICSPTLKSLILNNSYHDGFFEIVIDTPSLEVLIYDDTVAEQYPWKNLNSVRKAYIDIGPSEGQLDIVDDEDLDQYDQNVAELVAACCNVDFLYLSKPSVAAIHHSSCQMPTFHKLTELQLGNLNIHGWEFLPRLLESAPNLEILVFMGISEHVGCFAKFQSCLQDDVPTCLLLHLHSIYFEEFNGEQDELELVLYFWKNAEVLRKMEFHFCSSLPLEEQFSLWKRLLLLERSSKNIKIDFAYEVATNIVNFWEINESKKLEED